MYLLEHKVRKGCPQGVAAKGKCERDGKEEEGPGEGAIRKNRYNLPSANNRGLARARAIHSSAAGLARIAWRVCAFALHAD